MKRGKRNRLQISRMEDNKSTPQQRANVKTLDCKMDNLKMITSIYWSSR